MNHFDVDETIGYVNKIIENVRCATCDKLEGSRFRYPCGHTTCEDCVIYTEVCQICTSPSQRSESEPKPDSPLTQTVKNATDLLKASQKLFDVNVFLHKRISEQRRIEEELFPKCIQAPLKYENKRKSTHCSSTNKENRYSNYFHGEAISIPVEDNMENSINNVQQWLNKKENNFTRKPFSDLNVNTQKIIIPKNTPIKQNVSDGNFTLGASRKRSHFKTTTRDYSRLGGNRRSMNEYKSPFKKLKKESSVGFLKNSSNVQKCENDESGIFMDNDPIVIDDSQELVIDKDKNAWLAVLKASENEDLTTTTSLASSSHINVTNDNNKDVENPNLSKITRSQITSVPFFKRSAITETCRYCKNEVNSAKSVPVASPTKPVKITIDNDNYLTTITVYNNVQNGIVMNTTNNVSVQTNNGDPYQADTCINKNVVDYSENRNQCEADLTKDVSECSSEKQSIDLFVDDRKIFGDPPKPEISKCIVIEETDSDSDLDLSGPISVKVDVHRSCQDIEYGILREVHNMKEHECKPRRGPRGQTPTSTDSSEKENYNPNRIRKRITGKKKVTKK